MLILVAKIIMTQARRLRLKAARLADRSERLYALARRINDRAIRKNRDRPAAELKR